MSTREIEKRLAAIEQDIDRLKRQQSRPAFTHPIQALEQIHGTFENDEAFQRAMRFGRKWRRQARPDARKAITRRA